MTAQHIQGGCGLKKKRLLPVYMLLAAAGLAGCGADGQSSGNQGKSPDDTGYYAGFEDSRAREIGLNAPLSHMLIDVKESDVYHDEEQISGHLASDNQGSIFYGDKAYGYRDQNYHGQESLPKLPAPSYYSKHHGRLLEQMNERALSIPHVVDARSLIIGDQVVMSLLLDDYNHAESAVEEAEESIAAIAGDRNVRVLTDRGVYYRTRSIDNDLRDDVPINIERGNLKDLYPDFGRHEQHLD